MLSEEKINKFKLIYKNRFGIALSDEEALEKATCLVDLCRLVCAIKKENVGDCGNEQNNIK